MAKNRFELFKHNIRGWYRLNAIEKRKCRYNIIMGQKSNGKTYAVLEKILKEYLSKGKQSFYIRRYMEDLRSKAIGTLFGKGNLYDLLKGTEYTFIDYYNGAFYLAYNDERGKTIRDIKPFCYTGALNNASHISGTHYPSENIYIIFFDEFLTRSF